MKKILLATISVIYSLVCMGQATYKDNFIILNLPEGAQKLSTQQVDALSGSTSPGTSIKLTPPHIYKVDDIVFGFYDVKQDAIANDIQKNKQFMDEIYGFHKRNDGYSSTIKDINGNQILIISYVMNDIKYHRFRCTNKSKTLTLPGNLHFNKADSQRGDSVFNELIQNIKFAK